MPIPDDYPDNFEHRGLEPAWFAGIPWSIQRQFMSVERRLRVIRNPATNVFVVVIKLNPEDKIQRYAFFAVAQLVGWQPIIESKPGMPLDDWTHRACEGMRASAKHYDEHYAGSQAQRDAALRREQLTGEAARVKAMLDSTAETTAAMRSFINNPAHGMKMGMSPAKRAEKFIRSAAEYWEAKGKERAARDAQPFSLVSR